MCRWRERSGPGPAPGSVPVRGRRSQHQRRRRRKRRRRRSQCRRVLLLSQRRKRFVFHVFFNRERVTCKESDLFITQEQWMWIRIRIQIQHFMGIWMRTRIERKLKENIIEKKIVICLSLGHQARLGRPSCWRSFQPSKENIHHYYFCG